MDTHGTPRTALIEPTSYGKFFIRNSDNHVWDGGEWRGFGMAELYPTYADAFRDRRRALSKLTSVSA